MLIWIITILLPIIICPSLTDLSFGASLDLPGTPSKKSQRAGRLRAYILATSIGPPMIARSAVSWILAVL